MVFEQMVKSYQQHVDELVSSLHVPDAVAKMDPKEVWHDKNLERYEAYFVARLDLDTMLKELESRRTRLFPADSGISPTSGLSQ